MKPSDQPEAAAPVPGGKTVLVEFDSGIAWVTMNRPEKRNAISPALAAEMLAVVDALETDKRCGVLVLTGAGKSFSAGHGSEGIFPRDRSAPARGAHAHLPRQRPVAVAAADVLPASRPSPW